MQSIISHFQRCHKQIAEYTRLVITVGILLVSYNRNNAKLNWSTYTHECDASQLGDGPQCVILCQNIGPLTKTLNSNKKAGKCRQQN